MIKQNIKKMTINICLGCLASLLLINSSFAFSWPDLWLRPDQQAQRALKKGNTKQAAKLFKQPDWRAIANYRGRQYQQAATILQQENTPLAHYNRGNALAHLGQYQAAINAYDQALKLDSTYPDAKYNRDLLKKLLQQQKKQQRNNQQQQQQQQQQQKQQQSQQQSQQQNQQQGNNQQQQNQQQQQGKDQQKNNKQQLGNKQQRQNQQQQSKPQRNSQQQQQKQQQSQRQQNQQKKQKQQAMQQQQLQKQLQRQRKPVKPKRSRAQRLRDWQAKKWLDQIPDDPGGLLRQKFLRDYQRRIIEGRQTS